MIDDEIAGLLSKPDPDSSTAKLINVRLYGNGKPKISITSSIDSQGLGREMPSYLQACDSLGEKIFSLLDMVIEGESAGWEHHVVTSDRGLPKVIRAIKVGKGWLDQLH